MTRLTGQSRRRTRTRAHTDPLYSSVFPITTCPRLFLLLLLLSPACAALQQLGGDKRGGGLSHLSPRILGIHLCEQGDTHTQTHKHTHTTHTEHISTAPSRVAYTPQCVTQPGEIHGGTKRSAEGNSYTESRADAFTYKLTCSTSCRRTLNHPWN